jgi:membrane protein DedA with SNARE-associated domain
MDELVVRLVELGGYWGIFFLMIAENLFPPIPSELIMGMGGVFVARGTMEFWPLMLAGTAGTVIGNYAWYAAGDKFGYRRLRPLVDRWGRWMTLDWHDVEKATDFFNRHGQWVIFVMRFSPFLRTLISLPAGLAHMPKGRFLLFTTAGSAIWNAALIKGGELLGQNLKNAEQVIAWLTIAMIVILAGWYLWRVLTWKPRGTSDS